MRGDLHTLYRFFDAEDRLLYVGITCDPGKRIREHRRQKSWWTDVARISMEQHPDRTALLAAESQAIRTEDPAYNIQGRGESRGGFQPICDHAVWGPSQTFVAGDIWAFCMLTSKCRVGRVVRVRHGDVEVQLFSWLTGAFSAGTEWLPQHRMTQCLRANASADGYDEQRREWAPGTKVYNMDPLATMQAQWDKMSEGHERARIAVERVKAAAAECGNPMVAMDLGQPHG